MGAPMANSGPKDFAVSDFMSKVDNLGSYARRNKYSVIITPPESLNSSVPVANVEFLVKTITLPARTFNTATYRSGGKFALDVPYECLEEAIDITFLGTNDWGARTFWNEWIAHIQNTDTYNMQYYSKFIGTITVSVYDDTAKEALNHKHQVVLHECWPKTISSIELGWENMELVDFSVTVGYSWWTAK